MWLSKLRETHVQAATSGHVFGSVSFREHHVRKGVLHPCPDLCVFICLIRMQTYSTSWLRPD
jgi:hypothetical protein